MTALAEPRTGSPVHTTALPGLRITLVGMKPRGFSLRG